jgi:hypothetical protein
MVPDTPQVADVLFSETGVASGIKLGTIVVDMSSISPIETQKFARKIGPAIGAPLAAWLIVKYDSRFMFLAIGLGGLIWLIPWMLLVKDQPQDSAEQPASALAAKPVPFGRIMASPVTWGTNMTTFCYMYFVYFCMTRMPAYFTEQQHLSLSTMGLYAFFSFGGMAIAATLAGWAADLLIARGGNPVTVRKWFTKRQGVPWRREGAWQCGWFEKIHRHCAQRLSRSEFLPGDCFRNASGSSQRDF